MKLHEFSIVASGLDPSADDFEARFYDAGCDDALVSYQNGHAILDFAREADTFEDALSSAIDDVRAVGAIVERIEPDPLVNVSEIAARANLTRAAISLYAKGKRGRGFPAPVAKVTDESPLWDWSTVAGWLVESGKLPREALVEARVVREANAVLDLVGAPMAARLKQCAQASRAA